MNFEIFSVYVASYDLSKHLADQNVKPCKPFADIWAFHRNTQYVVCMYWNHFGIEIYL